jgi:ABC-type phosphonate transport system ATPase subunit
VLVERLIVEGDQSAASVDLHPRLTVMGGMPADARAAFGNLLAGALHGTARGVHAEVIDDSGRRLVVLRPATGHHRVVDVATSTDITEQYRTYDGRVDLLSSQFGQATITRITAADLRSRNPRSDAVRTLSAVDQVTLWGAADAILDRAPTAGAADTWHALAGDVDLGWATEHRTEIQAAARLRQHIAALRSLSSSAPDLTDDDAVALAHGIVSQLHAASNNTGTRPPVLLDETFDQLEPAVVPLLLELLPSLVGDLQVLLITEDEAIASWARLEALAGELSLVEPALAND